METRDAFRELIAQFMSFFDTGERNMTPPPPDTRSWQVHISFQIVIGVRDFSLTNALWLNQIYNYDNKIQYLQLVFIA